MNTKPQCTIGATATHRCIVRRHVREDARRRNYDTNKCLNMQAFLSPFDYMVARDGISADLFEIVIDKHLHGHVKPRKTTGSRAGRFLCERGDI